MEEAAISNLLRVYPNVLDEGPSLIKELQSLLDLEKLKGLHYLCTELSQRVPQHEEVGNGEEQQRPPGKNWKQVSSLDEVPLFCHIARENSQLNYDHILLYDIDQYGEDPYMAYYECIEAPFSGGKATVVHHRESLTQETISKLFRFKVYRVPTKLKTTPEKCLKIAQRDCDYQYRKWDNDASSKFVIDALQGAERPKPELVKNIMVPRECELVRSFDELACGQHIARLRDKTSVHDHFDHYWIEDIDQNSNSFCYYTCLPETKFSNLAKPKRLVKTLTDEYTKDFFSVPVYKIKDSCYRQVFNYNESKIFAEELVQDGKTFRCDGTYVLNNSYSAADLPRFIITRKISVKREGFYRLISDPANCSNRSSQILMERKMNRRSLTADGHVLQGLSSGCRAIKTNQKEIIELLASKLSTNKNIPEEITSRLKELAKRGAVSNGAKLSGKALKTTLLAGALISSVQWASESINAKQALDRMLKEGEITEEQRNFYLGKTMKVAGVAKLGSFAVMSCSLGLCFFFSVTGAYLLPIYILTAGGACVVESLIQHSLGNKIGFCENRIEDREEEEI